MNKTKALTETSIITALLVIIIYMNTYVPLFNIVGNFILPIPIAIIYLRWNYKFSLMSVIVSSILTMFFSNPIAGFFCGVLSGSTGLALGYCLKHNMSYKKLILILTIVSTVSLGLSNYVVIKLINNDTIRGTVDKIVVSYKQSMDTVINSKSLPKESLDNLNNVKASIINSDFILNLLPVLLIFAGILNAVIDYNMARVFLKRLKFQLPEKPPFTEFYFGKDTSVFMLFAILAAIIIKYLNIPYGNNILSALVVIVAYIFIIEGIAVFTYYLRRKLQRSKLLTVILTLLLLNWPFLLLFIYLGLSDLIFDFRRVSFKKGIPKKQI